MDLKILMLAWEYPPDHVGGLGRHVCHLSEAMVQKGAEVTVLTRGCDGKAAVRRHKGVEIISAVPYQLHPPDFVTWAAQFNVSMMESCARLFSKDYFDIVHAHDWIVAYAARALKHAWGVPMLATIHATECGRQKGLHNSMQNHISETEWWLCYEAWNVITCSDYMKSEVQRLFSVPGDKIRVIPNGIPSSWFEVNKEPDPDPLILYVGRLVPEKGPHVLLESMDSILSDFPKARLVFAGSGPLEGYLKEEVFKHGFGRVVEFTGHLGDSRLKDLYSRAWVAAFPSSYEPFGIVALEAMATGTACVVGDTGGLSEIIENGHTGFKVMPDNPGALANVLKTLLNDERKRLYLSENARKVVAKKYSWDDVSETTLSVYRQILDASGRNLILPGIRPEFKIPLQTPAAGTDEAGGGRGMSESGAGS